MGGPSLPDRVAQYYYSHALFCSSHPIISISVAITCFLLCCYPLLNIPLPGSTPTKISLPFNPEIFNNNNDTESTCFGNHQKTDSSYNFIFGDQSTNTIKLSKLMNETSNLPYIWAKDAPLLYIQQIILKTGVWPWREELKMGDAFRAPLQEVFRVLDLIRNHQLPQTGTTLGHICFHVENVKRNTATHKASPILPEYSCLVLSPANLWQQNLEKFSLDTNIIATVFNHQNLQKGKVSMADMVFGMQMKDTGIKRYPLRARTRTIQYAITLVFNQLHEGYIESLKEKILSIYPTQQKLDQSQNSMEINLIYYPGEFNYYEFVPLCLSFFGLFLYIYFSVRKIEFVKSKVGLAISAVVSVAASFVMSIGFCFFFGLTLSFQGKEIFPYLVILVGLENVFVLTKSVMSIDSKLDVKIRLAQGLSKEGWSITKNLLTELTILTISLFTFVAVIQQFSIFMIVSLLADFLLQMFFFVTVLGIDIKRKELSRDQPTSFEFYVGPGKFVHHDFNAYQKKNSKPFDLLSKNSQTPCMSRSKSHPKLNGLVNNTYTDVIVNNFQNSTTDNSKKTETKVPKRIRLVNVWARTRFFQRAFMIWMVVWISMILYSSGVVETLFLNGNMGNQNEFSKTPHTPSNDFTKSDEPKAETSVNIKERKQNLFENKLKETSNLSNSMNGSFFNYTPFSPTSNPLVTSVMENIDFNSEILNKTLQFFSLKNLAFPQPWRRLSEFHWASVLSQYNISIGGRYIAVLPPLLIRHRVTPEMAAAVHNPAEKDSFLPPSRWNALAAALDPLDFTDFEIDDSIQLPHYHGQSNWGSNHPETELPYYPTSPMEIFLLTMLCIISSLVIAYMMVVLYRCVCTRNYAEWRTSWTKDGQRASRNQPAMQIVMEAVPIVVAGHNQEVECLVTDGERVVSSCLQGSIRVWDFTNGEMITNINRNMFFELQNEVCNKLHCEKVTKNEDSKYDEAQGSSHFGADHQKCFLPKNSDYNEGILTDRPNRLWQSKFNFKKISNTDKPEDRRRCSSITGKAKTKYDFALQYRMLYEDSTETKTLKNENTSHFGDKVKASLNTFTNIEDNKPFIVKNVNCDNLKSEDENINSEVLEKGFPCNEHNVTVNNDCVCNAVGETHNVNNIQNISKSDDLFISNKVNSEVILKSECSDNLDHNKHLLINSNEPLKQTNQKFPSNHVEQSTDHRVADPLDDSIDFNFVSPPAIWCMDFTDDIIVIGCSNGRLEFWEASTGKLKCIFDDGYSGGVSHVRLTMLEELVLVAARLSGHLDLLQLHHPSNLTNKRTHVRTGSAGSISINNEHVYNRFAHKSPSTFFKKFNNVLYQEASTFSFENEGSTEGLCCMRLNMTRAHQQPISALECDGRRILTGSQDHTVKVYTINNLSQLYTLHGHCGPITCIFIDRFSPSVCGSGSQDGKLCVWDLLTGACVYSLQAHDGPISSLSYTASYVMSIGGDEKLCIWDRFRGHLLNAVNIGQGAGGCGLLSLTHSLVVTGGRGGLTVWDASTGMAVRKVHLGHNDGCIFVRQILPLKDSIVCDYANQLRIIRFPHVTKVDTNLATKCD